MKLHLLIWTRYTSTFFSCVADIPLTLRVLSTYIVAPVFLQFVGDPKYVEEILSLGNEDIQLALVDFSSIVSYDPISVKILHASLADFLLDRRRSTIFYIGMAAAKTDASCDTARLKKLEGIERG